ncbi:Oidioi.mRNA.OKI2018_I69.XSR.g14057.t1.cds [Oikopleura dioica]|uniref:Ubiquitin thioesterase OTU n=1 Tax=Oikopleura dioica TaxID=34765 RepID=A0ABN7S8U9_OIKDI|nr:Oidioi.mRNA.OKI2018_I69.XSR.g14057.t1.cds [Oikopleura dioica]
MTALRLNCRWSGGRQNLEGITAETTLEDLIAQIWSLSGVEPSDQILRSGYPPTLIDMQDLSVSLSTAGITNGSLIAVETKSKKEFQTDETPIVDLTKAETASQSKKSSGMRRFDVPGDNHCLFYSIYFLMNEGVLEKSKARQLRATVGQYVMQPSSSFTELVLGKPQDDYAAWIQSNNSWGGAVEVKIFSNLYRVEIHAVDIMTGRIDKYNGGKYQQKIFLLYDGIHYDPLYWEFEEQGLPKQTAFQSDDMTSELGAVEIARVLQAARQYTDVSKFSIKCEVCAKYLEGDREAALHVQETGHMQFVEI